MLNSIYQASLFFSRIFIWFDLYMPLLIFRFFFSPFFFLIFPGHHHLAAAAHTNLNAASVYAAAGVLILSLQHLYTTRVYKTSQ